MEQKIILTERKSVQCQETVTNVSFAVYLEDDFTGRGVAENTDVSITENSRQAIRNKSGYYVFTDLPGSNYTVKIENKYYGQKEIAVVLSSLDPALPLVNVTLKPNYLYPFGAGSTLVRGKIINTSGEPVAGASVEITEKSLLNISEADGRFVLYFPPLAEDEIIIDNKHRYVDSGSGMDFSLKVTCSGYNTETPAIGKIEEGKTRLITASITLIPV